MEPLVKDFSPAEICCILEISKSTLLRWEKEKRVVPAAKDADGSRVYDLRMLRDIARTLLPRREDALRQTLPAATASPLRQAVILTKFSSTDNEEEKIQALVKLRRTATTEGLTESSTIALLIIARHLPLGSLVRIHLWDVLRANDAHAASTGNNR